MRTLPRVARVSHGEVAERRGGVGKVETDTNGGGIFDKGVVKPCTCGVDFKCSITDVGCLGVRSTGTGDGQVGEIRRLVIGVVRVVVLVDVHATVHGIADVRVANDGVGVAPVVDVTNHDARVGGRNGNVGQKRLTVFHPNACHHGPR